MELALQKHKTAFVILMKASVPGDAAAALKKRKKILGLVIMSTRMVYDMEQPFPGKYKDGLHLFHELFRLP